MPKRADLKKILIVGAGPIVIGQACEFDYAGTQACKALKEEGFQVILLNSNPATMMTDPEIADATYIEPITVETLEKIIIKEKPCAILPTLGGQTALNCVLALDNAGILKRYQVELIGASLKAIHLAENRDEFQNLMQQIGLNVPKASKITSLEEAKQMANEIQFPVVVRPSYALGGTGAGIAKTKQAFIAICEAAFAARTAQSIMVDEALLGWKEFELEVIRDKKDNCIIVCGIENLDPLGIHTGDSITVAPIQTLTDKEYQAMRKAAFAVLRAIGVDTGGSNVQFAVHPQTGKMVVIEMNPRVSRSSALVSKASGFPIAKIAAKLAVGFTLDELKNDITGDQLPASFEPSLDYVVVKIPRFNFEKFPENNDTRGPQMRSIGEVMGIGRTFTEALQKAMRSLELGQAGFGKFYANESLSQLKKIMCAAGPLQLWAIGEALRQQIDLQVLAQITHIDPWFLANIAEIISAEQAISKIKLSDLTDTQLRAYKKIGFSNSRIAQLLQCPLNELEKLINDWQLFPVYKRIDSCAGEYATSTAYLYSTYESVCEAQPTNRKKMIIIGSGPNRIGQGIEFDYCCVHAAKTLREAGFETIMLNCNPETVSTDYDIVDRLYCTPLTLEDVLAIIHLEKPVGVFVQYGGQTPLQLAEGLAQANVPLLGIDVAIIQQTENRQQFQAFLTNLNLKQPKNSCIFHLQEATKVAEAIGYPLIIRPSFVLGGAAMSVVKSKAELDLCLQKIFAEQVEQPVLIEKFLEDAIEIDVDAISDGEDVFIPGLLEHIESAGVHSGDSACITPPITIPCMLQLAIMQQVKKIAKHLHLRGVFNLQFAIQNQELYVLEVNPRASRTLPFLCKATGIPLVKIATQCVLGAKLKEFGLSVTPELPFYAVKEAVLPFDKFIKTPAILGPEMKATGEAMGLGATPEEAFAKAEIAAFNALPKSGCVWIVAASLTKELQPIALKLNQLGFTIHVSESAKALSLDCSLIIAINDLTRVSISGIAAIQLAIAKKICYATTLKATIALANAIEFYILNDYTVAPLQTWYKDIKHAKGVKHFLTGEELPKTQLNKVLQYALKLKKQRYMASNDLARQTLALIFDKPSLRTRFSFTVAMRELGGDVIESLGSTRKNETPEDTAQVLSGYCDAIMVRTHQDSLLEKMANVSSIPIINGLSDLHHPCQILADLLTLLEWFGDLQGLKLTYIGDGNNILHSLLLIAPALGINIHYCCPSTRGPNEEILARSRSRLDSSTGQIHAFEKPHEAVKHADAVYTDVWTSMGFENQSQEYLFEGFQVNENLMQHALPHAVFMHCLPMERGKEVSETLPDASCSVIFRQSENRKFAQKALLLYLLRGLND